MNKFDVQMALNTIREARAQWLDGYRNFNLDTYYIMRRLLNEAAVNYMSAEDVARESGFTVKAVREFMRQNGLNPKNGKRLLAKTAAKALTENAALLGITPQSMDMMSPLAYLPMGEKLKRELIDKPSQVTELPEDRSDLEDRLYQAIVLDFEGRGEAWTTDDSGDTLARAAAVVAVRELLGAQV